jgi:hypothetical protein
VSRLSHLLEAAVGVLVLVLLAGPTAISLLKQIVIAVIAIGAVAAALRLVWNYTNRY